jgi:hypothetical protein
MIFDMAGDADVTYKISQYSLKDTNFTLKPLKATLMDQYLTLGDQPLEKRRFFSDSLASNNALCIRTSCFFFGIAQEKCHCYQGEDTGRRGVNCQNRIPSARRLAIQLQLILRELNLTPTRCLEVEHPEQ